MALQDVLEQWNKVMPEKITEAELLNPKESFLVNCIKNIFYKINQHLVLENVRFLWMSCILPRSNKVFSVSVGQSRRGDSTEE